MNAKTVWAIARRLNRVPGAYAIYRALMQRIYRDGATVVIKRGPLAGRRWRHQRCHQTWMAAGLYEPHVAALIQSLLAEGDVFYDVGANAGYFSLVGASCVGERGKVIAFEPNPLSARTILEQVQLNGYADRCRVETLAVSDRASHLRFIITSVSANAHLAEFAAPHLSSEGETISVGGITLDEYVEDNPRPTLIKMDIEGAEVAALRGAQELLRAKDAPILLVSTHGDELERQAKELLTGMGYSFRNLKGFEQMIHAVPAWKAASAVGGREKGEPETRSGGR